MDLYNFKCQLVSQLDHGRVKVPYPVKLQIIVLKSRLHGYIGKSHYHSPFNTFCLELRHYPEYYPVSFPAGFSPLVIHEFDFPDQVEVPVQVLNDLVDLRYHNIKPDGLLLVIGKPDEFFVHYRLKRLQYGSGMDFCDILNPGELCPGLVIYNAKIIGDLFKVLFVNMPE